MYTPSNPQYRDWIDEFYTPLFVQVGPYLSPYNGAIRAKERYAPSTAALASQTPHEGA